MQIFFTVILHFLAFRFILKILQFAFIQEVRKYFITRSTNLLKCDSFAFPYLSAFYDFYFLEIDYIRDLLKRERIDSSLEWISNVKNFLGQGQPDSTLTMLYIIHFLYSI